jgi:ornithine cyclodeaminase/alanine dehydrogenase-like protein (mu-crystallin family)
MPLHFDSATLNRLLPMPALIEQLARAFRQPANVPLRQNLNDGLGHELLVMPALANGLAGVKLLTIVPENRETDRPVIDGTFVLLDMTQGGAVATMDASQLTARRTAAISALAARQLARGDASTLLIVGAGHLAPYMAEGHASIRPIRNIRVWARNPDKAARCIEEVRRRLPDLSSEVAHDLASAVAEADIVSAVTRATEPVIKGEWLRPGVHVDLVGGYRPDMRELDDDGIAAAEIYVENVEAALTEAGDLRSPIERGIISRDSIRTLADLLTQPPATRTRSVTVFKSVGSALSDLTAAELAWRSHGEGQK